MIGKSSVAFALVQYLHLCHITAPFPRKKIPYAVGRAHRPGSIESLHSQSTRAVRERHPQFASSSLIILIHFISVSPTRKRVMLDKDQEPQGNVVISFGNNGDRVYAGNLAFY